MFPLKADVPSRSVPFITIALIAVNVLVFLYQLSLQVAPDSEGIQSAREFVFEFGLIPCRLTGQCGSSADFPSPVTTVFTDRKSTRLNSSHVAISYADFCLKKKI